MDGDIQPIPREDYERLDVYKRQQLPLALSKKEDAFSKDLLLLMLKQYNLFLESFQLSLIHICPDNIRHLIAQLKLFI